MNCKTCGTLTSEQFCSSSCFEVATARNCYIRKGYPNGWRPAEFVSSCVFNDPTTTDDSDRWEGHQKLTTAYDAMYWHHLPGCIGQTTEFHSTIKGVDKHEPIETIQEAANGRWLDADSGSDSPGIRGEEYRVSEGVWSPQRETT